MIGKNVIKPKESVVSFCLIHRYMRRNIAVLAILAAHGVMALPDANPLPASMDKLAQVMPEAAMAADPDRQLEEIYIRSREAMQRGSPVDAFGLLRLAAEGGYALAMHDLALHLRSGTLVPQNYASAAKWYRRAAESGSTGFAGSQNNLGDMYENGQGVKKSSADAIYWYTRAALQGEPTAYLSLGICFADGIGVAKDTVEAYFWLSLAVENMHEGSNRTLARNKLRAIEKLMFTEQVEAAKAKAKAYRPYMQTPYKIGDPLK